MAALYGELQPQHVGYQPPAAFSDNLQGCSAYAARGHWHYITYGLSELYVATPEDDPAISGWGFELTIRVPRADQPEAPAWPFTMLNEMAKHVNRNAVVLDAGHRIDLGRPVTGFPVLPDAPETDLTVFAVTIDPELGTIATTNGRVTFLQLVGITQVEKDQMIARSTSAVLAELASTDPLLITDPLRA